MSISKEDLMNEAYDAGLVTLGAVGVGFASKKILKDRLGVPSTPLSIAKFAPLQEVPYLFNTCKRRICYPMIL